MGRHSRRFPRAGQLPALERDPLPIVILIPQPREKDLSHLRLRHTSELV
jgi:hypothetical protein